MIKTARLLLGWSITGITMSSFLFSMVVQSLPVINAYINFAGAGGNFSARTATFQVPEKTTVSVVKDGLRAYDLHVAKMIELTNNFCEDREPKYVIHWNYTADGGKIFMGEYNLTCQFARDIFKKFGTTTPEMTTIHYVDNPQKVKVIPLNLNRKNAQEFMRLVQSIKPQCIETTPKICPGDRLEL